MNSKETSLGIDIGCRSIKFVELYRDKNDIYLKDFAIASSGAGEDESPAERAFRVRQIIENALRDKKFDVQNVFITVSDPLLFTRFIKVPFSDDKKVSQMISFEALQQIPFPLEEVVWDYQILRADLGEAEAILVAIKSESVYLLLSGISLALAHADIVDVSPLSLGNIIGRSEELTDDCCAFFSIGAKSSCVIVMNKDIFWLRILPLGGDSITSSVQKAFDIDFETAEEYKMKGDLSRKAEEPGAGEFNERLSEQVSAGYSKIVFEAKRSLNFFKTQYPGQKVASLSYTGGASGIEGFEAFLRKSFPDMPVKPFNPFSKIMLSDLVDQAQLKESSNMLAEAAGMALRGLGDTRFGINLMPKSILSERSRKKNLKYYAGAAAFILMIFLSRYYYDSKIASLHKAKADSYSERLAELQRMEQEYQAEKIKADEIERDMKKVYYFYEAKTFWLRFITNLEKMKNENVWFTAIEHVSSLENYTGKSREANMNLISQKARAEEGESEDFFYPEKKTFIVLSGETSSEYEAISSLEKGLAEFPMVAAGSVRLLYAKAPIDGVRAFAIGMELKSE